MTTNNNLIKCEICNKEVTKRGLYKHIHSCHNISAQDYYDTYLRKPNEGICPICGKPTKFKNITTGYPNIYCSIKCSASSEQVQQERKQTTMERYGVEHALQNSECLEKMHNTMTERYGVEHALQNKDLLNKQVETTLNKFGCKNACQG